MRLSAPGLSPSQSPWPLASQGELAGPSAPAVLVSKLFSPSLNVRVGSSKVPQSLAFESCCRRWWLWPADSQVCDCPFRCLEGLWCDTPPPPVQRGTDCPLGCFRHFVCVCSFNPLKPCEAVWSSCFMGEEPAR